MGKSLGFNVKAMGNHLKSQGRERHDLVYDLKEYSGKEMKHPKGRIELEKTSKRFLNHLIGI